jgi:hypothetical protein
MGSGKFAERIDVRIAVAREDRLRDAVSPDLFEKCAPSHDHVELSRRILFVRAEKIDASPIRGNVYWVPQ